MATAEIGAPTSVLTLDELAILEMTSPSHIEGTEENQPTIITTKDAYLWAVLFSQLVSDGRDNDPEWFLNRFRSVLGKYRNPLRSLHQNLLFAPVLHIPSRIFVKTGEECGMNVVDLHDRTEMAYRSLLNKELIEDPFKKKIASLVVAVLSIIPTGFTSTTEKGGAYKKEIHAVAWSYEHTKDKNKKETEILDIRLLKLIKTVQTKMIDVYDETISENKPPITKKK